jgi:hypothetical protein
MGISYASGAHPPGKTKRHVALLLMTEFNIDKGSLTDDVQACKSREGGQQGFFDDFFEEAVQRRSSWRVQGSNVDEAFLLHVKEAFVVSHGTD